MAKVCQSRQTQHKLKQNSSIGKAAGRLLRHSRKSKSVKFCEAAHQAQLVTDSKSLETECSNSLFDASQETLIMKEDQPTDPASPSQTTPRESLKDGQEKSNRDPCTAEIHDTKLESRSLLDASVQQMQTSSRFTA